MSFAKLLLATAALLTAAQPVAAQAAVPGEAAPAPPGSAPDLYRPQDKLEEGLWMEMEDAERGLKTSQLIIRDPALNQYVRGVLCRTVGQVQCANIRLYLVRTPNFNAATAPNGAMQVWSGLLLRVQNEAQLSAVLAHEYVHFEKRHSLTLYREAKSKSAAAAWLAFTGIGLIASFGLLGSIFKFSREQEREADLVGLQKLAAAGYDTREAAVIWEQLREEMDATAAARGTKSRKDKTGGLYATHPPSAERVAYLRQAAQELPGVPGETGGQRYRAAMAAWWPVFVDDQLKMNDFGASAFLLASIAKSGEHSSWIDYANGELYRRRALAGDLDQADRAYSTAIAGGDDLPELWRGRGLARLKLGEAAEGRADLKEYLARSPNAGDRDVIMLMSGGNE